MKAILFLALAFILPSCEGLNTGFNISGEFSGELDDGTSVGISIRPPVINPPKNSDK